MQGKLFQMCSRIFFTAVYCLWAVNYQNVMLLSSSCLQIPPRENWFQYVRRVYATAIYFPCIITLYTSDSLLIKDITRLWPKHTVQTSNMEYKCMGRFCILNLTQFSQNHLLLLKYCSAKDCNSTSSSENGTLHTIKE